VSRISIFGVLRYDVRTMATMVRTMCCHGYSPTSVIIGILQPNAEPLLSTCGGSLNSSPTKALLAFSLSRPTASSNDMAFRFSDAKIDSLSANFGSSALLAVEGDRKTTISAKFAFTARRSARQKGEPYNKCSIVTFNNRILWNSISYTGPKLCMESYQCSKYVRGLRSKRQVQRTT